MKSSTDRLEASNRLEGALREYLCEGGEDKHYYGRRVELNAFASDDFIKWIESKLDKQTVKKIVPDDDTLKEAYARAISG